MIQTILYFIALFILSEYCTRVGESHITKSEVFKDKEAIIAMITGTVALLLSKEGGDVLLTALIAILCTLKGRRIQPYINLALMLLIVLDGLLFALSSGGIALILIGVIAYKLFIIKEKASSWMDFVMAVATIGLILSHGVVYKVLLIIPIAYLIWRIKSNRNNIKNVEYEEVVDSKEQQQ